MKVLLLILFIIAVKCEKSSWNPALEDTTVNGVIKHVQVLFRTGHHVPVKFYPKDPNANSTLWNDGLGQLTEIGRQQAFQLGQNLKSRYASLIAKEKPWKSIEVWSSETDRTLMTAATVLAGLLPSKGNDRLTDLNWQPVPIHSIPKEEDNILFHGKKCRRFERIMDNLADKVPEDKHAIYDYIEENTGLPINLNVLAKLYNIFDIELQAGLKLSNWTNKIYPEFIQKEAVKFLKKRISNKSLIRLRVGPLLEQLFKKNKDKTMLLYSTHDAILSDLLNSIGIKNLKPPGLMSVIIIEYREITKGQIHAQLFWREGPNDQLNRLHWPDCGPRCPVKKIKKHLLSLIPLDWEEECALPVPRVKVFNDTSSFSLDWEVVLPTVLLVTALLIALVYVVTIRCKCDNYPYEMI